jgi:hypothetical protein
MSRGGRDPELGGDFIINLWAAADDRQLCCSSSPPPAACPATATKLTSIDVVVATKEALKIYLQGSKQRDLQNEPQATVFLGPRREVS